MAPQFDASPAPALRSNGEVQIARNAMPPAVTIHPPGTVPAGSPVSRRLGRYSLRRLLGKSSRSMLWLADAPGGEDVYLMLPRQQPGDATALAAWEREARHAARLQHPQLVPVLEIGVEERWPYIVSARAAGMTLAEQLTAGEPPAPLQSAQWLCDLLQGLAFVHEAGLAHGDVNTFSVLVDAQGRTLLLAGAHGDAAGAQLAATPAQAGDTAALQVQRAAGERDLLACGLLLHRLLAGQPALDEPDLPTAVQRLEREIVRLGWTTPQPVPETLRAIVNRATEREPRRRYLAARSLQRALQGWIDAQAEGGGGALSLLLDRLHSVGHLPALPGLMTRVSMLAAMEQQRLDAMIDVILQDPALAFELLRQVNGAQFAAHASRGAQGEGGVSTVRRAVQLIGVQGLRRAASGLRTWPGAASDAAAAPLAAALREAQLAAHVARTLCPADMDGEAAYIVALLQQLGRLLLRYHFADEADQIERLVDPDAPGQRGMPPHAAEAAVIGTDCEAMAVAVARHWGLDEAMLQAMRRVSADAPVRAPDQRRDVMRLLGSAAAEAVAAVGSREARASAQASAAALARVTQRYARALVLAPGELAGALMQAQRTVGAPAVMTQDA